MGRALCVFIRFIKQSVKIFNREVECCFIAEGYDQSAFTLNNRNYLFAG